MHPKTPTHRTHSLEFKAQVLAACRQPGASIAAVALAHGINANVAHKWLAGIGMKRTGQQLSSAAESPVAPMQFLPVGMSTSCLEPGVSERNQDVRLDLDLGAMQIKLNCTRSSAPAAAALLHALAEMVASA